MTLPGPTRPDGVKTSALGMVRAFKAVKFRYESTPLTREVLETFREMVNDAIRICLAEHIRGRLKLRDRIHKEVQERYGVVPAFPYSVSEVAWSIAKKHRRWHRKPFAGRLMMKMDAQNFSINYSILSLPYRKVGRVLVPLEYGCFQRSFLMDTTQAGLSHDDRLRCHHYLLERDGYEQASEKGRL